jgi:hypothetical protein
MEQQGTFNFQISTIENAFTVKEGLTGKLFYFTSAKALAEHIRNYIAPNEKRTRTKKVNVKEMASPSLTAN